MGDKTIENIVTLEKLMTDDNFNVTPANGTSDKLTAKDHNLAGHTIRIEKTEDAGVFAQTENKFNIVFKSDTSEVPVPGFNKVVFSPGTDGQFKDPAATHVLYVRPDTIVNLADRAPEITANAGKAFIGWDTNLVGKFEDETTITAKYSDSVSDNYIEGWTKISFNSGENGRFAADVKTSLWVNPKEALTLADAAPEIIPNANYSFKAWTADGEEVDLDQAKIYNEATTFTATYESDVSDEAKEGFVKVSFNPGEHGKFAANAVTELYVRADKKVDLSTKAPKITPYTGYSHIGWTPKLEGEFSEDTIITAQYEKAKFDSEAIKELIVQGPNKVTYAEGERLDLEGLRAIAIDNKGMKKTYVFAGGTFKDSDNNQLQAAIKLGGNAVNLDDLPELTNAEHDGKNIIVVYNNVEYESSIKLSVSKLQSFLY